MMRTSCWMPNPRGFADPPTDPYTLVTQILDKRYSLQQMSDEEKGCDMAMRKILDSSARQNVAHLKFLVQAGFPATPAGMTLFLASRPQPPLRHGRVHAMRHAVRWLGVVTGSELPQGQLKQLDAAAGGYCGEYPETKVDRGAISHEMFLQVLPIARRARNTARSTQAFNVHQVEQSLQGMIIQFAFGLRPGHPATLEMSNFTIGDDGERYLVDVRQKQHKAKFNAQDLESHTCLQDMRVSANRILDGDASAVKGRIFEYYSPKMVTEWIREAALTHEWDSGLNWTCHCLRHGAAAEAARHGGVRAAIAQCGWKSVVAASIYSRPNRLRSTAVGNYDAAEVEELAIDYLDQMMGYSSASTAAATSCLPKAAKTCAMPGQDMYRIARSKALQHARTSSSAKAKKEKNH